MIPSLSVVMAAILLTLTLRVQESYRNDVVSNLIGSTFMSIPIPDTLIDMHQQYSKLLDALPLFAEEGPIHESLSEDVLLQSISDVDCRAESIALLHTVRILFDALGLLDRASLAEGVWAFVSFPASLAGRSLLATMSVPGQTLVDSDYWEQGSHRPNVAVEEQRHLLQQLERRRERLHPTGSADPIRTVHAAWGIIKIDGRFLLRHREDRTRQNTKNYVFVGGRLNMHDLPAEQRSSSSLRDLHSIGSVSAKLSLRETLRRELAEECQLLPQHYRAEGEITLAPYRQVEGAGNKHALTQYNIVVFPITLNEDGELHLLESMSASPDDFAWFDLDELFGAQRSDGKQAFVNALVVSNEFDTRSWLEKLPDSSAMKCRLGKDTDAVDIPGSFGAPFFKGKTGKEKWREVVMTEDEWGLLMLGTWHALGLKVAPNAGHLHLVDNGWVVLESDEVLKTTRRLIAKLDAENLHLGQLSNQKFFRLSIEKQYLHLDRKLFTYELKANENAVVKLAEVDTVWGQLKGDSVTCPIEPNMFGVVQAISHGEDLNRSEGLKIDNLARVALENFKPTRRLGLRKFLYTEDGNWDITCRYLKSVR